MKVKVGKRDQIETTTLHIPHGEDAWIEFRAGQWDIKIKIVFEVEEGKTSSFNLDGKGDHAVLTFINWDNALPSASLKPQVIGESEGRKVSLSAAGFSVSGFKFLSLAFYWEN